MAEPVSSAAATASVASLTLATFASAPIIQICLGAFAGALFLIILNPNYPKKTKAMIFVASFIAGVISADAAAALLTDQTPDSFTAGAPIGAMVSSFLSLRILSFVSEWMNKKAGIESNVQVPPVSISKENEGSKDE